MMFHSSLRHRPARAAARSNDNINNHETTAASRKPKQKTRVIVRTIPAYHNDDEDHDDGDHNNDHDDYESNKQDFLSMKLGSDSHEEEVEAEEDDEEEEEKERERRRQSRRNRRPRQSTALPLATTTSTASITPSLLLSARTKTTEQAKTESIIQGKEEEVENDQLYGGSSGQFIVDHRFRSRKRPAKKSSTTSHINQGIRQNTFNHHSLLRKRNKTIAKENHNDPVDKGNDDDNNDADSTGEFAYESSEYEDAEDGFGTQSEYHPDRLSQLRSEQRVWTHQLQSSSHDDKIDPNMVVMSMTQEEQPVYHPYHLMTTTDTTHSTDKPQNEKNIASAWTESPALTENKPQQEEVEKIPHNSHESSINVQENSEKKEEVSSQQSHQIQQIRVEHELMQQELVRQNAIHQDSVRAVEHYQSLRLDLINFVGALRCLQQKMVPLQKAFHALYAERVGVQKKKEWQIDVMAVLSQHGRLDQVIGSKQDLPGMLDPLHPTTRDVAVLDEFGRDKKSQFVIQRELRRKKRRRIFHQRFKRGREKTATFLRDDESDAFMSDEEEISFRTRRRSLALAMKVAISELDEEFTSLQRLVDLFALWKERYPDDYRQCYANLSLADLTSVLILVDLCTLVDSFLDSTAEFSIEGKWITIIRAAVDKGLLGNDGMERILEKAIVPSVADFFEQKCFSLLSSSQTVALSTFMNQINSNVPSTSQNLFKLRSLVQRNITTFLRDMPIAIVRKNDCEETFADSEELNEVMYSASEGQMHTLQKIVLNLINSWITVLGTDDSFVQAVLDFVSSKVLFLLSSLRSGSDSTHLSDVVRDSFQELWAALQTTGWLDDPRWMIQTVTIRAAAAVFRN